MTISKWILFLLAFGGALAVKSALACDEKAAKPLADRVTYEIDLLVKFTKAACIPTRDGQKCSVLCISDLNISGLNRSIVLMFITASAGKKMRDAGIAKFDRIIFADRELLLAKRALQLSAERASQLQLSIANTKEKPEVVAERIGGEFKQVSYAR